MDPGLIRDGLTVALGVASGAFSAAFGVGGAIISTPGIRLLGASALEAVGTTLPSILPSAASGTLRYAREDLVSWDVVAMVAPAGVVGAVAGSLLSGEVPGEGHWLMVATAALLGLTAWRLVAGGPGPDEQPLDRTSARRSRLLLVALGLAGGLLSGLLGIGGGVALLPGFIGILGLPTKRAVATSLACVGILAVPGTITHAALGHINWGLALFLAVGVVPGARLGAAATIRAEDRRLRLAVAAVMGALAVVYGVSELRAAL